MLSPIEFRLRNAGPDDLDALVRIENESFDADRISRRSFRKLIAAPTAACIVAEANDEIAGYALLLFRKGTALARLYSIAVSDAFVGQGVGGKLLEAAEDEAYDHDRIMLRLEVREDNKKTIALYEKAGYRRFGRIDDYYADHADALRFEKILRPERPPETHTPYYMQTTEFTCGPACVMMANAHFDSTSPLDQLTEVSLWREATTIFMASSLGGCEPFGLAVAVAERGLAPEIFVNTDGPLFLDTVRSENKRTVMRLTQKAFQARAGELAIPVRREALTIGELTAAIADGAVAIVLISGYRMFGKKVPHWVLVHGDDGSHLFIHDPWVEDKRGETFADASNLPIPYAEFDAMARYGRDGLRTAVVIRKG